MEHEARARPPQSGGRSAHRAHDPSSGCICPEENIEQGLASPDENARLAVMLGAFCGLRRIEMTRINLKTDLEENAEGMVLHVHGKGNRERMLPARFGIAETHRRMAVPRRRAGTLRRRLRGEEDQDGNRIPVAQPAP